MRRLGQHFLVRQSILEAIASAACEGFSGCVIEIGPGRGALTSHLLKRAQKVVAVEIDPVLTQYLRGKFRGDARLELLEADVLKIDLGAWGPVTIAGNLPYYITSPIVEKVLALGERLHSAVFLLQKEVAERITASPGSRDYGYLSVQTQLLADVQMLFPVSRTAFRPPPKVESSVIHLTPRRQTVVDDTSGFLKFASHCFRQKRKTLRNNLLGAYEKELLDALPEGQKRAEQLSIAQLAGLYRQLNSRPAIHPSKGFKA